MPPEVPRPVAGASRAVWVTRLRLGSGLVLFTYLTTHYANHALGLVSLQAMEEGRVWFLALWRNPIGSLALYGALLTHLALALRSLYRRRHFRMPAWEATQVLLGLAIPPLLAGHIVGTRVAYTWLEVGDPYSRVLLALWHLNPGNGLRQSILLLVAWTHGCIGLHFWLRIRPWYPRAFPLVFAGFLLLPVTALLGFAEGGREVAALAGNPEWGAALSRAVNAPGATEAARLARVQDALVAAFGGLVGAALLAQAARLRHQRRRGTLRLTYPGGRTVEVPAGLTVLEASRQADIPHASVCGGRGRCSTCRVRVVAEPSAVPPPSPQELRVLRGVGAPPNVRLACQLRPTGDVAVTPVLPADVSAPEALRPPHSQAAREQDIAVLFADLRAFTRLAEHKLPYDVVFFLNRYFEVIGSAVTRAGGITNQFTGDGVMALFGVETGADAGCRQALVGAGEIARSVAELSRELAEELGEPLRIGIGIHAGPAVVGRMGYAEAVYLTAVGDTVHVASRLEGLTKEYDCQLVISEEVARRAGADVEAFPAHELNLRGRVDRLAIRVVPDAQAFAGALGNAGLPPGSAGAP
jgi:adenylate cyclase